MLRPATDAEVVEVLRSARAEGRRVRLSGDGVSAAAPRDGAVAVSLAAYRGIVDLRPDDLVLTVRSGTRVSEIDAALGEVGRRLPLRPWTPDGRGTIGGAVAAAADGLVARDGRRWRDLVLGATLALGSGDVVRVGAAVVKSVAGLDVTKCVVGCGGSWAVILSLDVCIEGIEEADEALFGAAVSPRDVAALVADADAAAPTLRGCVITPDDAVGGARVDVRLGGRRAAVRAASGALRAAGFGEVPNGGGRWDALTARMSAPPPAGTWRRTGPALRSDPAARFGAEGARGWTVDLPRRRAHWSDPAPPPAPEPAARRLLERVHLAIDPFGVFQSRGSAGSP